MNNIGLFFGSFNPVHIGHLALANYIVENSNLNEIWFVVSPQNPFKKSNDLIDTKHRITMLELCVNNYSKFKVSAIEQELPSPSYSYVTLRELRKLHPDNNFSIIMGSDNLELLMKWKNIDEIIKNHNIIVYPRPGYPIINHDKVPNLDIVEAPVFNIDSTRIRKGILEGKNYGFLVPKNAYSYITKNNLYSN
ncbi:nicotinate (nicotinamide) nucleotide adenylyltransferase [Saccharicrinis aurantiacus]|uniref:nicotinate (nicotinamide) nucleotide adenylyltransferase n=1 Tax=Saccharicrinis aurantiacus TaxID=1849719 RepID=UPI0024901960|nr:nicotinate (nicotinamide) nucleotide adenylyltransferase [Saccharicrinis aurantiacus]